MQVRTFAADPAIFPCELSAATLEAGKAAVKAAVASWGERSLPLLEAEDRWGLTGLKGIAEYALWEGWEGVGQAGGNVASARAARVK